MDSAPEVWPKLQSFMKRECGVVLQDDQEYLLDARLGPVAQQFNCSLATLVADACNSSMTASPAIIDALTTHESFFFRDQSFWRAFEELVVPRLAENANGHLRFWSAACAHGQEPYSLAMLLEEKWPQLARHAEIIATDVSAPAIERAREGLFTSLEVNRGLPAARLLRHFEKDTGGFRIKKVLRDRISWSVHNLLGANRDPADCDVVLCRNVLIYFSEQDRKTTLARIESAARPGGFIVLGGTETSPRMQIAPGMYELSSESIAGMT